MKERRAKGPPRRGSDKVIREIIRFNRILLDILEGRPGPFLDHPLKLEEVRELLGRRKEDRQLAGQLVEGLKDIINRLVELGVISKMPRRVRIIKISGSLDSTFPEGTWREGWEKEEPRVGIRYCLYQDNGKIYKTSPITKILEDGFETVFSVYRLQIIEQN